MKLSKISETREKPRIYKVYTRKNMHLLCLFISDMEARKTIHITAQRTG